MAEKTSFWSDFKTFIARGNVMDMAVGVVVGGAFTAIVNSLVGDIINPLIGKLFGGVDLSAAKVVLTAADEEAGIAEVAIRYGAMIQAILNFLIVALCVFAVVRFINRLKDKMKKEEEEAAEEEKEEEPAEPSEEVLLLREIRDSLQK
ncbi:MAG: large-conductance mechanosensitive channel protein MscL [Clostridia bacterium]|jgi:large conductance mechanosensitive channel|nr:large-conductance mechanosensitive channel protein MscL [Clostridia bacterium]MBQ3957024.1 large-conductance mechanosensitive channel protein MscL [Clostridia bacterium]